MCINAAADVTAEGGLTGTTARQQRTLVKRGIEDVIFTSQNCRHEAGPSLQDYNFNHNTSGENLAKIRFCSTGVGAWSDKVCGFQLIFVTGNPIQLGNCQNGVWDVMPDFVLAEWEAVLMVEACFGSVWGHNVVHTIKLVTNLRSFGPVGTSGGCVIYRSAGYDLTGFYGGAGYGIDSLGAYFSRC